MKAGCTARPISRRASSSRPKYRRSVAIRTRSVRNRFLSEASDSLRSAVFVGVSGRSHGTSTNYVNSSANGDNPTVNTEASAVIADASRMTSRYSATMFFKLPPHRIMIFADRVASWPGGYSELLPSPTPTRWSLPLPGWGSLPLSSFTAPTVTVGTRERSLIEQRTITGQYQRSCRLVISDKLKPGGGNMCEARAAYSWSPKMMSGTAARDEGGVVYRSAGGGRSFTTDIPRGNTVIEVVSLGVGGATVADVPAGSEVPC